MVGQPESLSARTRSRQLLGPFLCWAVVFADIGTSGSTELHLTSLEQSLLYLVAANAGPLVTREQIMDNL